jgi:GDP-L-fucose synthase
MSTKALKKDDKIFVAGHRGLVGSSIVRKLVAEGYTNVVTRTRQELDLTDQASTYAFLRVERPDAVVVAAAKVGGILANSEFPADFISQNLILEHNLIWGSHLADVPTLLFLGSSCVYPRETPQPIPETALLSGPLEPTNAPYAVAKIAGINLCDSIARQFGRRYFSAMPPNVYGPYDNFDLKTSHVLPALIRKFHEALPGHPVEVWGTGNPRREFLHSDDVSDALLFLLNHPEVNGLVNIGTGKSVTIRELAETIQRVVEHRGEMVWNTAMPDGFPEKTMDVSRLHSLGWRHRIGFEDGLRSAYKWYRDSVAA